MSETPVSPRRHALPDGRWRVGLYLGACLALGIVAGVVWALTAFRPGYEIADDLGASLGERGLAGIFAADATFSVLLAAVGLGIGVAAWLLFHRHGWWVCMLAVVGGAIAAVVAWQVGLLVTPNDFEQRLASAVGGDVVPVDLQLRSMAALLVAPFAAITPVMLFAAFWPERSAADIRQERDQEVEGTTAV